MFILSTMASTAPIATTPSNPAFMQLAPLILILAVFIFFVFIPQHKKAKQHQQMLSELKVGDKVVTSSGIMGTIHKINNENEFMVTIAPDVHVHMLRSAVAQVMDKKSAVANSSSNGSKSKKA